MPYRYPPEFRRNVLDLLAAGRSVVSLSADLGGSVEEGGHLCSGDWLIGAVLGRLGGAALGDSSRGQGVDVGGVDVVFDVGEPCGRSWLESEGADQEGGHLSSGDRPVGAVAGRIQGASYGDSEVGELLGVADPPLAVRNVGEAGNTRGGGVLVKDTDEPYSYYPALYWLVGTEQPLAAFGVCEQRCFG